MFCMLNHHLPEFLGCSPFKNWAESTGQKVLRIKGAKRINGEKFYLQNPTLQSDQVLHITNASPPGVRQKVLYSEQNTYKSKNICVFTEHSATTNQRLWIMNTEFQPST